MAIGMMRQFFIPVLAVLAALSTQAQAVQPASPPQTPPAIVFQSGMGDGSPVLIRTGAPPPRPEIACAALPEARTRILARFYTASPPPRPVLAKSLFDRTLESFIAHHCRYAPTAAAGPGIIIIVDFAKHSSVPRLYVIDLVNGTGLESPILVAHGIGSDRNDDGFAETFSNTPDSLASSLGAARGAEIYSGQNGRSLRLDGLEASNNAMRYRDIVVHSYAPERRRYFSAALVSVRGGRPGASEGCFVVEPDQRDRVLATLTDGGFLYAGYSGVLPQPAVRPVTATPQGPIVFAQGTGAVAGSNPQSALVVPPPPASGILGGTSGNPPIVPISPAPATPPR